MNTEADNKPKAGKILRNFGFLTTGRILGDLFIFVLFVVISRKFGKEGIGNYSFAIALTGFFMILASFGLTKLSIKVMSCRQENVNRSGPQKSDSAIRWNPA